LTFLHTYIFTYVVNDMEKDRNFKNPLLHYSSSTSYTSTSHHCMFFNIQKYQSHQ